MAARRLPIVSAMLLLAATGASTVAAQVPLAPRALGMAGAVVGGARGHDALFVNPANLGLPGTPRWSVAAPQITLAGTLAGPALGDLPDLLRYDDLSDARRDEIFGGIPESGAEARFDVRAPLVAFQWKRLAFGLAYGATGEHRLSRDVIELALYGYEQGRVDYDARGTVGSRMTFWDLAVAYGDRTGPLSWGVAAHYLRGGTLLRSWVTDPRVDLAATDIDFDYVAVLTRGGHGFALDVGAAYQPHRTLTFSAAVANAFAGMDWSDERYLRNLNITRAELEDADPVDLLDLFAQSERPVGAADSAVARGVTARTLQERAYLPTVVRLGVGWEALPWTQFGVSYYGALTGGRLAGSWNQMLGLGVQQRIPLALLRAGFATDLGDGWMLSGGLSLGPIEIGVARLEDGEYDTSARSGWIAALGLNIRTRSVLP